MSAPTKGSRWLPGKAPGQQARIQLFCLPYAGGGAGAYQGWQAGLPEQVGVRPVHLPGREGRFADPVPTRVSDLVDELLPELRPHLDRPFALFGHSLGGFICYELMLRLRAEGGPMPTRLFASASRPPQADLPAAPLYGLPEDELMVELRRLGGTPQAVLQEPELMRLFLPLLRADFEMADTYQRPGEAPFDVPITTFGGAQDIEVLPDRLLDWERCTSTDFEHHVLPGDHFFLHSERKAVLERVGQLLLRDVG